MMPGEREVLERLALELEILNRREELKRAEGERPVLRTTYVERTGAIPYPESIRSDENTAYHKQLRAELDAAIARRRSWRASP